MGAQEGSAEPSGKLQMSPPPRAECDTPDVPPAQSGSPGFKGRRIQGGQAGAALAFPG